MSMLSEIQFKILDSIYFVEPFLNIVEEVGESEYVVGAELKTMIHKGWIQVMEFDKAKGDFMRTLIYDGDNMKDFSFLATKEGLFQHNSR